LALGLLTICLPIQAAEILNVVIDIDGVLAKRIPGKMKEEYLADTIVEAGSRTFVIRPFVLEVLEKITASKKVKLHFVTGDKYIRSEHVAGLFKGLPIGSDNLYDYVKRAWHADVFDDGVLNLEKISGEKGFDNFVAFVDANDQYSEEQKQHFIVANKFYYAFNDFEHVQSTIKAKTDRGSFDNHKNFIPEDEEDFETYQYTWKGIHFVIQQLLITLEKGEDVAKAIDQLRDQQSNIEKSDISTQLDPQVKTAWKVEGNVITGCQVVFVQD